MEKKNIINEFVTCPCSATDCSTALGMGGRSGSPMRAEGIMEYLNKSHSVHFDGKMAVLEEGLDELLASADDIQKKIVGMFFSALRDEVAGHFEYEERTVFPYVASLLSVGGARGRKAETEVEVKADGSDDSQDGGCSINLIEENHNNIMEKLGDLKTIVEKHLPTSCDRRLRNKVLLDIFNLEEDLEHHIRLEDDILMPVVKNLEKNGR